MGYTTSKHKTVPHNPSIPISNKGGALASSMVMTFSSNTNCSAWTNAPAMTRATPSSAWVGSTSV
jgi:hypothetical protein